MVFQDMTVNLDVTVSLEHLGPRVKKEQMVSQEEMVPMAYPDLQVPLDQVG